MPYLRSETAAPGISKLCRRQNMLSPESRGKTLMRPGRIKLLKFVTLFEIGGTERHFVSLVRRLDPSRFELSVACLRRTGAFLKEIESMRIPLAEYNIHSLRSRGAFKEEFRFGRRVRRDQIQIVHTYGLYPNIFAIPAARLAGAPVIVASIRETGETWTPMQRRAQKFACHWADCILVNSEAVKRRLIAEGYNREKFAVIKNGIDLARFTGNGNSGRLRRELGLPAQAPLVVVLSRLDRLKGVEYFLGAASMMSRQFPEARFLIVGNQGPDGGVYRETLEHQAARLGLGQRVIFTGSRLDVPEVLSEAAVSVVPSLSEGLSNTLLESMAVGAPVVATSVGGNPEAMEDGVNGLLVPPRDAGALARAVSLLLENRELARRLGEAGKQRVTEHFSLERMVRETENLYLTLLSRSARRLGRNGRAEEAHAEPTV